MKEFPQMNIYKITPHQILVSWLSRFVCFSFFILAFSSAQNYFPADPYNLLLIEKAQFQGSLPQWSNSFRPLFFKSDTISIYATVRSEGYYNDNAPNQENMDVRYFSRGFAGFNSFQIAFNSPYLSFIAEPYIITNKFASVEGINRKSEFSVLNDRPLENHQKTIKNGGIRNFLAFIHYKGIGIGWHRGNRWWGPGIHSSFQMTNNTIPIPSQIIGTMQEVRIGPLGIYGLYSFSKMNDEVGKNAKYFTSLNAQLSWYGSIVFSLGFSRNYLTGGWNYGSYVWKESDARKIVFEGLLTSDLIGKEYTVGGHDVWDQTLSGYVTITLPNRNIKAYAEFGMNDNRMYFADFLSQPDHSMATIFGIRDYGVGKNKNYIWGFEWTNLMITYSSRHRPTGPGAWYRRAQYEYSSYGGRRWGAHSGTDSDDWYLYAGYLSDKLMVVPALNYERHGIVSHRPAEVKLEFSLDTRYKYKNTWFGIYYEKQFEAFLGFPDYFYMDDQGNQIDASEGRLANSRRTNTIILSMSKTVNF